jgi:hypothetical protein
MKKKQRINVLFIMACTAVVFATFTALLWLAMKGL